MENELKNALDVLESHLKNNGYGIRVFWNNENQLSSSNYETRILEHADESGKPKVVDVLKFDLIESLYRFAKNGPTKNVSERQPKLTTDAGIFDDVKEIADFHKAFRQFSLNKEVDFYSEDGNTLTVEVVEVQDMKTHKPTEKVIAEIKADNIKDLLSQLESLVQERLKEEKAFRDKRASASEWGSEE